MPDNLTQRTKTATQHDHTSVIGLLGQAAGALDVRHVAGQRRHRRQMPRPVGRS